MPVDILLANFIHFPNSSLAQTLLTQDEQWLLVSIKLALECTSPKSWSKFKKQNLVVTKLSIE